MSYRNRTLRGAVTVVILLGLTVTSCSTPPSSPQSPTSAPSERATSGSSEPAAAGAKVDHRVPVKRIPVRVELSMKGAGWQLLRGGEHYYVKGAGGSGPIEMLAAAGGNSMRTWSADDLDDLLDEAHRLGLSVTVGVWLGHERHGFDYNDAEAVARQLESVRTAVRKYKDHPAVLAWGLGNEMEGFEAGDNVKIWRAVNDAARAAKQLDANHPTMTTIAELGGKRVELLHKHCPDIDIVGINSYGGVPSIPERYRAAGGTKPYIATEYGPPGTWEVGRNSWGAVREWTSTEKAGFYRRAYDALRKDDRLNLGSYAFTWGSKREATATWFGLLLPDGSKLAGVDALTEAWSGRPPANRCPEIRSIELEGSDEVDPGTLVRVRLEVSDPEGDAISVEYQFRREQATYFTGGDTQAAQPMFVNAIEESSTNGVTVRMPKGAGKCRLYAFVRDGRGGAATANVPIKVNGPEAPIDALEVKLPFVIYADTATEEPYIASGWMGDTHAIEMNPHSKNMPREGKKCLRVGFKQDEGWGGVVWQNPANDWGDKPGGYDLTGAKTLSFWARGENGGEKVKFGLGLLGPEKKYRDTSRREIAVTLTRSWKRYTVSLAGEDLSRIKSGFYWVVAGQGRPVTFYVDDVRYTADE